MLRTILLLLVCLHVASVQAAELNGSATDSLLAGQQELLLGQELIKQQQQQLLQEAWDDPFLGRNHGIELNLAGLLLGTRNGFLLMGSYSYFPQDTNMEFAFPFFYHHDTGDGNDLRRYALDFASRFYLGKHRTGLYVQGGVRLVQMSGYADAGWFGEVEG